MLTVPDHRAGTRVRCWQCKREVTAPELSSASSLLYSAPPEIAELSAEQANKYPPATSIRGVAHPMTGAPPVQPASPKQAASREAAPREAAIKEKQSTQAAPKPTVPLSAAPSLVIPKAIPIRPPIPVAKAVTLAQSSPQASQKNIAPEKPNIAAPTRPMETAPKAISTGSSFVPSARIASSNASNGKTPEGVLARRRPIATPIPQPPLSTRWSVAAARRRESARWLSLGLIGCASIGVAPAIVLIVRSIASDAWSVVGLWVFFALVAALVKSAYAAYLWQLFDWGASAAVAILSLAFTTIYAALSAAFLLARDGAAVQWLGVPVEFVGRAAPWCFLMLCLCGSLAYFAGQLSLKSKALAASR
jgi:hypothetical protein